MKLTRKRLLLLTPLTVATIIGCRSMVASSPEGTVTDYVRDSGVLVYAPRAARAQKVVFDTSDKQLIHERDTPLRKFFNAHAYDFKDGMVTRAQSTILADIVARLRNREFIREMVAEVVEDHRDRAFAPFTAAGADKATVDKDKADRAVRARLLTDAIYQGLLEANYPDMRDADLENLIDSFNNENHASDLKRAEERNRIWKRAFEPGTDDVRNARVEDFVGELLHAMRERRFFREIILRATEKRLGLFKSAGSPEASLKAAQNKLKLFVTANLTQALVEHVPGGKVSLWRAFLEGENSDPNRRFQDPATTNALTANTLKTLGAGLRKDVLAGMAKGSTLEKAMRDALATRGSYLTPTLRASTANAAATRTAILTDLRTAATNDPGVQRAYAAVQEAAKARKTAYDDVPKKTKEEKDAREAMEKAASEGSKANERTSLAQVTRDSAKTLNTWVKRDPAFVAELDRAWTALGGKPAKEPEATWNEAALAWRNISPVITNSAVANLQASRDGLRAKTDFPELERHLEDSTQKDAALLDTSTRFLIDFEVPLKTMTRDGSSALGGTDGKGGKLKAYQDALATLEEKVGALAELDPTKKGDFLRALRGNTVRDWGGDGERATAQLHELSTKLSTQRSTLTEIRSKRDTMLAKAEEVSRARTTSTTTERNLAQAIGTLDPPSGLFGELARAVRARNDRLTETERQDVDRVLLAVTARAEQFLAKASQGLENLEAADRKLSPLLTYSFEIDARLDTDRARDLVAQAFARTFKGYSDLIGVDSPIIAAVIGSDAVTFDSADQRKQAVGRVPKRFNELWETAKTSPIKVDTLAETLAKALESPNIAYLFGVSPTSSGAIRAFREELYQALKARLPEVVAAERGASYDYWWLTFYPKAIPLGDRKLEGQSIIEVAFPERAVPKEQYHRWLQDQGPGRHQTSARSRGTTERPVDPNAHLDQTASDVLTGFLAVMRAPELTGRHTRVLGNIVHALHLLTSTGSAHECKTNPCQSPGKTGYCAVRKYLMDQVVDEVEGFYGVKVPKTVSAASLKNAEEELTKQLRSVAQNRLLFENKTQDKASSDLIGSLTLAGSARRVASAYQAHLVNRFKDNELAELGEKMTKQRFQTAHVVLALRRAVESRQPLPAKVELYLNAYFDGGARFSRFAVGRSDYVFPFAEKEFRWKIDDFLFQVGISPASKPSEVLVNAFGVRGVDITNRPFETIAAQTSAARRSFRRDVGRGLKYSKTGARHLPLRFVELWDLERELQASRAELQSIVRHQFFTAYPGVPDARTIQAQFLGEQNLHSLIYQWLSPMWTRADTRGLLGTSDTHRRAELEGMISRYLDAFDLTANDRRELIRELVEKTSIYDWRRAVLRNTSLVDQLQTRLLPMLYRGLWTAISKLSESKRRPTPFASISPSQYDGFLRSGRAKLQPGIQVIDLLPASRDDLVGISINEGGVIARAAAQAEGAAAYDLNELALVEKNARLLAEGTRDTKVGRTIPGGRTEVNRNYLDDLERLKRQNRSLGYSAGMTGEGSIYARARAALAYARRREYLDAAITAAGRGDNFAKWVVRKSDLRSSVAGTDASELVAAAHNGYPNGDQPFHLLVRIPHDAIHEDWRGRRYILFNSAYVATSRTPLESEGGWFGWLAKGFSYLLHPPLVDGEEERVVGTTYPFKWNVQTYEHQQALLRHTNSLGGRIYLEDTDKIQYSEVRKLIDAEAGFIKTTRALQSQRLSEVMEQLEDEAEDAPDRVRENLRKDREALREQQRRESGAEEESEE